LLRSPLTPAACAGGSAGLEAGWAIGAVLRTALPSLRNGTTAPGAPPPQGHHAGIDSVYKLFLEDLFLRSPTASFVRLWAQRTKHYLFEGCFHEESFQTITALVRVIY